MTIIQQNEKAELATNFEINFLSEFAVTKVINDLRQVKTIEKAVITSVPSIATIRRDYGEQNALNYIMSWILYLDEFIDLKEQGSDFRIKQTAKFILFDYYNLTIADIHVIFRRAICGYYGKFYDRLSGATIISWFETYLAERCDICEMKSILEHQKTKHL